MKYLISILLIVVMGSSNHKEIDMPMIREDGKTERQVLAGQRGGRGVPITRPPAWLGNTTGNGGFGQAGAGGNATTLRDRWSRLNELGTPSGIGGGSTPVPNFNTPASIAQGQQAYAQDHNIPAAISAPTPGMNQIPAWLRVIQSRINNSPYLAPTGLGGGNALVPNFNTPTSIAQGQDDGNVYNPALLGITPQGTPTMGVNSFIGQGGDAVRGPNQQAYTPWMPAGVNTFIGAGGQAVRGPMGQAVPVADAGGGIGFGTNYYGNWRKGGGGGGYGGGGYSDYGDAPAWMNPYMNLYSLNWKG